MQMKGKEETPPPKLLLLLDKVQISFSLHINELLMLQLFQTHFSLQISAMLFAQLCTKQTDLFFLSLLLHCPHAYIDI